MNKYNTLTRHFTFDAARGGYVEPAPDFLFYAISNGSDGDVCVCVRVSDVEPFFNRRNDSDENPFL